METTDTFVSPHWDELKSHSSNTHYMLPDLDTAVKHSWTTLQKTCHSLPDVNIHASYDNTMSDGTLGSARRSMFLRDGVWVSSMMNDDISGVDVTIRINPNVPNGWHMSYDGSCDIGYQYDLKTVLLHELLHGIGLSSSVTPTSVGYSNSFGTGCYPTLYDTKIQDTHGFVVNGCSIRRSKSYNVGGVSIYTPDTFNSGSSFSHTYTTGVMHYSVPSRRCMSLASEEYAILKEIGVQCTPFSNTFSNQLSGTNGHMDLYNLYLFVAVLCFFL